MFMCGRRPRCKSNLTYGLRSGASHVSGLLSRRMTAGSDVIRVGGLSYLCEGDLASSVSESLFPDTQKAMRSLAGGDPLADRGCRDLGLPSPKRGFVAVMVLDEPCCETRSPCVGGSG
jgi:hypothetical protein